MPPLTNSRPATTKKPQKNEPLPTGNNLSYFWGYFVVAGLLFGLGGLAGFLAAKFFKASTPPVPTMAIDEAGKIRKTFMRKKKR